MIAYKNIGLHSLTFYGVTFNPNEIKEVPGFINHVKMIRVKEKIEPRPKSSIVVAKAEVSVEEKPKRQYNRKNKNQS